MQTSAIAKNYARIFYQVCEENDIVDDVLYDGKVIESLHINDVKKILSVPIISKEIKKSLVDSLSQVNYRVEFINLLKILLDNNELKYFTEIFYEYQNIYQEKNDIKIINVTMSKYPSSQRLDQMRILFEKRLNKFVIVLVKVDPTVIGGIKIEYDGKVIDNTVEKQLKKISNIKIY